MSNVNSRLSATRTAVDDLLALSDLNAGRWDRALQPGKWLPSQIVEHLALTFEESAKVVRGQASAFPSLPRIARPLLRSFVLRRVNRTGRLPNGKTPAAFDPATGPDTPRAGRARLGGALAAFEQACRESAAGAAVVESSIFGRIGVDEYVRFQEVHTRHHAAQLATSR